MLACGMKADFFLMEKIVVDKNGIVKGRYAVPPMEFDKLLTMFSEPYAAEGVWQKIEIESMNVVLVNGEKRN